MFCASIPPVGRTGERRTDGWRKKRAVLNQSAIVASRPIDRDQDEKAYNALRSSHIRIL